MSEQNNFEERTEQATPKKLADARKKGKVARSREFVTTAVMITGSAALLFGGQHLGEMLVALMHISFAADRTQLLDSGFMLAQFGSAGLMAVTSLLPLFAVLAAAAMLASVALGGWSFAVSSLALKAERISVTKGIKRIFSVRGLVELLKALAKFALIAVAAAFWLAWLYGDLRSLSYENPGQALLHSGVLCLRSLLALSLVLLVVAAVDVPFQLWQHRKNLRMTRQEVRDEQKDTDGKPEVRQRIRMLQQQLATRRMMEDAIDATVVITNPTHYAVAIRYDEGESGAPVVVAKGKDLIAARIREIAEEHSIELFSSPPLARVLYRTTKIGQQIPYELYRAVAQVLAYVYQVRTAGSASMVERPDPQIDEAAFGFDAPVEEGA